jgi:hypothetical protein
MHGLQILTLIFISVIYHQKKYNLPVSQRLKLLRRKIVSAVDFYEGFLYAGSSNNLEFRYLSVYLEGKIQARRHFCYEYFN